MLTSAIQCLQQSAATSAEQSLASVSEDRMLTLCNTVHAKERWNERRTNMGSCVRGSGMPLLQHNVRNRALNERRTKARHPCQRIRMLTFNTMHHSTVKRAQKRKQT
jgi:hypothetical protein